MRLALLVMALALCPALVKAQSAHEQLSVDWWLLTATTSGATDEERTAHAIQHGVDTAVAQRLVAYVDLGNKQLREFGRAEKQHICANQTTFAANRGALADAIDRTDTLEEAILNNLFKRMDANMKAGARMLIEHARPNAHVDSDGRTAGEAMRTGTGDLAAFLKEVCSREDAPQIEGGAK